MGKRNSVIALYLGRRDGTSELVVNWREWNGNLNVDGEYRPFSCGFNGFKQHMGRISGPLFLLTITFGSKEKELNLVTHIV